MTSSTDARTVAADMRAPVGTRTVPWPGRVTRFGWYAVLMVVLRCLLFANWGTIDPAATVRAILFLVPPTILVVMLCVRWLGPERGPLMAAIVAVVVVAGPDPRLLLAIPATASVLLLERRRAAMGRLRLPWARINEALTVATAAFVVVQLVQLLVAGPRPPAAGAAWATALPAAGATPDLFVILADGHPRADILRELYSYDPAPFLRTLDELDFDVATDSRANYLLTRFSLASFFTGSYLMGLDHLSIEDQNRLAARTTHDNPTFALLARLGYDVTVVSSGYEHLGLRGAPRFIDTGQLNEYETALVQNGNLGRGRFALSPTWDFDQARSRVIRSLDVLTGRAAAPSARPEFTFVHIPVPHWPWVFNSACGMEGLPAEQSVDPQRRGGTEETRALMAAQTRCVDGMLAGTLRELVSARPEAVVLLFSDHGSEEYLDWWDPDDRGLTERTANLVALRSPGKAGLLPDDVTLVNVLPRIFNAYLGMSIPLQPDQTWFGPRPQDNRFVLVDPMVPRRAVP